MESVFGVVSVRRVGIQVFGWNYFSSFLRIGGSDLRWVANRVGKFYSGYPSPIDN